MADCSIGAEDQIARLSISQGSGGLPPPQPPGPGTRGLVYTDVTKKFTQAVGTLSPGDLVKDGFFTLFEALPALEIMDPKMDSGCTHLSEGFEEIYDVSRPLLPEQVLGIMDQLLCYEMTWHLGYPLSQTLFTCVYVEALLMPKPREIDEARFIRGKDISAESGPMLQILRAYCLGMLKVCGCVNERVRSEHYYEEEDFVTNTYHRDLMDQFATEAIRFVILQAAEHVESQRGCVNDDILDALLVRLNWRLTFLSAAECPEHMQEPSIARKHWEKGLELLPRIRETHGLGKPVEEAFSAKLQKKMASTVPLRPIVKIEFEDAFGHLSRLFKDGLELIDVLDYTDSQCLQTFVSTFQARKPQPLIYVRTLLQTFLFNDMQVLGRMSIRQILDNDFSIVCMAGSPLLDRANDEVEATRDVRFLMSQEMELFRTRAAQPFLDILRTACQNRCRTRRTLVHMVRAWDNLQMDAEQSDEIILEKMKERTFQQSPSATLPSFEAYALPLSSWTYLYKLKHMEEIVQMGFELDIYQADELAGLYWYLNYLAKFRLQHSERIKSFTIRSVETYRTGPRHEQQDKETQLSKSLAFIRFSLLDSAVTWELSDALSSLYVVLGRLGLVQGPSRPYSSDRLRYELRMKPFAAVGLPALPSFEDFTAAQSQSRASVVELLSGGEEAVAAAKKGLETMSKLSPEDSFSVGSHERWVAGVKNRLKSCIATGLAISAVRNAVRQQGTKEEGLAIKAGVPKACKGYHDWWIVPTISKVDEG